jgi:cell division protein FtsL
MNPFGIQAYRSKRMPRSEKALYLAAVIALIVLANVLRS